jgi:hypothetical protein
LYDSAANETKEYTFYTIRNKEEMKKKKKKKKKKMMMTDSV